MFISLHTWRKKENYRCEKGYFSRHFWLRSCTPWDPISTTLGYPWRHSPHVLAFQITTCFLLLPMNLAIPWDSLTPLTLVLWCIPTTLSANPAPTHSLKMTSMAFRPSMVRSSEAHCSTWWDLGTSRTFSAIPVCGGRSWRAHGHPLGGGCPGRMCWVHATEHVQQREALMWMYMR